MADDLTDGTAAAAPAGARRAGSVPRPVAPRGWSPAALTIAGADSSGGAGLAADLRAFAACGVYGAFAVTLVSAQSTAEFRSAQPLDAEMVAAQIHAVLDDMPIAATKTGLLLTPETIAAVASIASRRLPQLVVDPVLVDGAGEPLLSAAAEQAVATRLLPCARVVTPNHLEAARLLGATLPDDPQAWVDAARELAEAGPEAVVITGGRRAGGDTADGSVPAATHDSASGPTTGTVTDVVVSGGRARLLSAPRVPTRNVRGSGDVFSAAICAELAKGTQLDTAIDAAHALTARAVAAGATLRLGRGPGPVDPITG